MTNFDIIYFLFCFLAGTEHENVHDQVDVHSPSVLEPRRVQPMRDIHEAAAASIKEKENTTPESSPPKVLTTHHKED